MAYKPRFGTVKRDTTWQLECLLAHKAGRGPHPICNLCDKPVSPDQPWDESHHPDLPRVFGGRSVGVAHRDCNRKHGAKVVKPQVDKCDRVRSRHLGVTGPGLGRYPMRAGARSPISKTMRHGVQPRLTLGQKMAALREKRSFVRATDQQPTECP